MPTLCWVVVDSHILNMNLYYYLYYVKVGFKNSEVLEEMKTDSPNWAPSILHTVQGRMTKTWFRWFNSVRCFHLTSICCKNIQSRQQHCTVHVASHDRVVAHFLTFFISCSIFGVACCTFIFSWEESLKGYVWYHVFRWVQVRGKFQNRMENWQQKDSPQLLSRHHVYLWFDQSQISLYCLIIKIHFVIAITTNEKLKQVSFQSFLYIFKKILIKKQKLNTRLWRYATSVRVTIDNI